MYSKFDTSNEVSPLRFDLFGIFLIMTNIMFLLYSIFSGFIIYCNDKYTSSTQEAKRYVIFTYFPNSTYTVFDTCGTLGYFTQNYLDSQRVN